MKINEIRIVIHPSGPSEFSRYISYSARMEMPGGEVIEHQRNAVAFHQILEDPQSAAWMLSRAVRDLVLEHHAAVSPGPSPMRKPVQAEKRGPELPAWNGVCYDMAG